MNENNQDRIEVAITAAMQQAIAAINKTNANLKQTASILKTVKTTTDSLGNTKGITIVAKEIKQTTSDTKSLNEKLSETKRILLSGFNFGKIAVLSKVIRSMFNSISSLVKPSVDFIETTNKFEVAMGNMSDKAYIFQNKLSEAFGTVTTEMMNFQATFKNIMSSLPGLTNEASEQVSETLVKLGLDYSSLYNVDQDTAMSRIQSALVGSVKPIRSDAGYDVTDATIAMKAQELGISSSVRQLNQMEKRLLRIIVLMDQMRNTTAMQDLARTIEQPANQIKVLKNQIQELGVWLGNVFIGVIGKILPYINGFVMALVAILKTLATFVGFTNTGSGLTEGLAEGLETADTAVGGISSGMGSAAKSAKELKKTLMGFDVLNVIQTPSESSSGSGGGGGGGGASIGSVNPAILKALSQYDNLMDSVQMKATGIRDKIMDWLGFTKVINPLTGEVTWKLREGLTWFKAIVSLIKGLLLLGLAKKVITLIGSISSVWGVLKGTTVATTAFGKGLETLKGIFFTTAPGVGKHAAEVTKLNTSAIAATAGIIGLGVAAIASYKNMKEFAKGNAEAGETAGKLALSIGGAAAAGALLGSVIPGVGTAVGALAGATVGASAALIGYYNGSKDVSQQTRITKEEVAVLTDALKANKDVYDNTVASIQKNAENQILELETTKKLTTELGNLVDSNGKVKKGYEDRVDFILKNLTSALGEEYKRDGDIIKRNGEIVTSYSNLKDSIFDTIEAKKESIRQEAYLEVYKEDIKRQIQLEKEREIALQTAEKALQDYLDLMTGSGTIWEKQLSKNSKNIRQTLIDAEAAFSAVDKEYQEVTKRVEIYNKQMTDSVINELKKQTANVKQLTPEMIQQWKSLAQQSKTEYEKALKGLPETTRQQVRNAVEGIANETKAQTPKVQDAVKGLKNTLGQDITGTTKVKFKLESDFSALLEGLNNIKSKLGQITGKVGETFNPLKNSISSAISKLRGYATGGFPEMGEIFMAREAGPELVGTIGNKSAVVNNQQIVEAVSTGVAKAVSGVLGNGNNSNVQLYIDGEQITNVVQKRIARKANITGMAMGV